MTRTRFLALCALLAGCTGTPTDTGSDAAPNPGKTASGPVVTSTTPSGARQDTTLDVHVFGSGFDRGSKVAIARDGVVDPKVKVNATTYRASGELVANVTIAADAETVPYDVIVTTSSGKKGIGTELFTVDVPLGIMESPSGTSMVTGASPTGLLVGRVTTSCGTFGPALWDRAGHRIDLPVVAGSCGGIAQAVNGSGVAVGTAYNGSQAAGPVRWLPSSDGYVAERLPPLPDGTDPGPWGVNGMGWISSGNAAAVWLPSTGWRFLTMPAGASRCVATQVGNSGQIVSHCLVGGVSQGVFWDSLAAEPIVLPLPPGGIGAYPHGINTGGTIVGFVTATDVAYRGVRWTRSGTAWTVELLPDLGKGGSALAINDAGYIAGSAYGTNGFARPAFWEPSGVLHILDTGDRSGEATGISEPDGGVVIGGYFVSSSKSGKLAARWEP
jgi:hypothetical protein